MKKTLFVKRNIKRVILIILMVVLVFILNACTLAREWQRLEEKERLKQEREETEAKEEELSNLLEEIYISYSDGEEALVVEFNSFLENNFKDKERILNCLERQKVYNEDRYEEYIKYKSELEETLKDKKISTEEFEEKEKYLLEKYNKSKNKIQQYLTKEEIEILESVKEEIKSLYEKR